MRKQCRNKRSSRCASRMGNAWFRGWQNVAVAGTRCSCQKMAVVDAVPRTRLWYSTAQLSLRCLLHSVAMANRPDAAALWFLFALSNASRPQAPRRATFEQGQLRSEWVLLDGLSCVRLSVPAAGGRGPRQRWTWSRPYGRGVWSRT